MIHEHHSDDIVKKHLFYNQVRVNIAVAIVILRKNRSYHISRDDFVSQIQSSFLKNFSENRGQDGFDKQIISNVQEKLVQDFIKVLPAQCNNIGAGGTRGGEVVKLVNSGLNLPNPDDYGVDEDSVCDDEMLHGCEFLRLVLGLRELVQSSKPLTLDSTKFNKGVSDFEDSGVDCNKTLNSSAFGPCTSIVSLPAFKFRLLAVRSETSIAVRLTVERLIDLTRGYLTSCEEFSPTSPATVSVLTLRTLVTRHQLHIPIISDLASEAFRHIWTSTQPLQIVYSQWSLFSRLLCHNEICGRLVDELIELIPPWCQALEQAARSADLGSPCVGRAPIDMDILMVVLTKYLSFCSDTPVLKEASPNIKCIWRSMWNRERQTQDAHLFKRKQTFGSLSRRMLKLLHRTTRVLPLLSPQVYTVIEILNRCQETQESRSLAGSSHIST